MTRRDYPCLFFFCRNDVTSEYSSSSTLVLSVLNGKTSGQTSGQAGVSIISSPTEQRLTNRALTSTFYQGGKGGKGERVVGGQTIFDCCLPTHPPFLTILYYESSPRHTVAPGPLHYTAPLWVPSWNILQIIGLTSVYLFLQLASHPYNLWGQLEQQFIVFKMCKWAKCLKHVSWYSGGGEGSCIPPLPKLPLPPSELLNYILWPPGTGNSLINQEALLILIC